MVEKANEIRALVRRCEGVDYLPEGLQDTELQQIERAIRELELIDETREFRHYARDLAAAKLLVPPGHAWSLYSDGCAGCEPYDDEDLPTTSVECMTPELGLCAAALEAQAALLDESPSV